MATTLKMYSEEQMKEYGYDSCNKGECRIPEPPLPPPAITIELPSDEEIREHFEISESSAFDRLMVEYESGQNRGAKWMRDEILKQIPNEFKNQTHEKI